VDEIENYSDSEVNTAAPIELRGSSAADLGPDVKSRARGFDLKLFFGLLASALLGSLAILPYSMTLTKQMDLPSSMVPLLMAVSVAVEFLISAGAIGVGMVLVPRVGSVVVADTSMEEKVESRWLWKSLGMPVLVGMALGGTIGLYASRVNLSGDGKHGAVVMPEPWEGLLASFGAGVREEIWLRLGFMTFFVWLLFHLWRLVSRNQTQFPSDGVVWTANLVAALGFAAIHIPQAQALLGLSVPILIFIFVGNGVPGLAFGWLFWRRGLLAAMSAHFGLDFVLKVLIPLIS
jgi:hypothetical protein